MSSDVDPSTLSQISRADMKQLQKEYDQLKKAPPGPNGMAVGAKVGRNASCPCGSGLKYKRCCVDRKQAVAEIAVLDASIPPSKRTHTRALLAASIAMLGPGSVGEKDIW